MRPDCAGRQVRGHRGKVMFFVPAKVTRAEAEVVLDDAPRDNFVFTAKAVAAVEGGGPDCTFCRIRRRQGEDRPACVI